MEAVRVEYCRSGNRAIRSPEPCIRLFFFALSDIRRMAHGKQEEAREKGFGAAQVEAGKEGEASAPQAYKEPRRNPRD